ncbi:MAG: hypothetical protein VX589_05225 [Myxococcota bacterium]|nr:hypothetical protein [Myxococcota bacterium]
MRAMGGRLYATERLPMFFAHTPQRRAQLVPPHQAMMNPQIYGFDHTVFAVDEQTVDPPPSEVTGEQASPSRPPTQTETADVRPDQKENEPAASTGPQTSTPIDAKATTTPAAIRKAPKAAIPPRRAITTRISSQPADQLGRNTRLPDPDFQVGGHLRLAYAAMLSDVEDSAFFPMQTELYRAYRPYNPTADGDGRLTLALSLGALSMRTDGFDEYADRLGVTEWYALYDNLPHRLYVRGGRFLPAHGWRTDDDRGFSRRGQNILGAPFDHSRQVTGIEAGFNRGGSYGHLSVFNASNEWSEPVDTEAFNGMAAAAGYRVLEWQAGGSLVYGHRGELGNAPALDQFAASAQWALNLDAMTDVVPLIYLAEFNLNAIVPESGHNIIGLSAMHEIGYLITQGLNFVVRYEWMDPDIDIEFDTQHRQTNEVNWFPVPYVEVSLRYQHNWRHTDDRYRFYQSLHADGETLSKADADEVLLMIHGFY